MNRTLIRRLVASTAAAALISASSFLGAAGAYANPSGADATGIETSSTETPAVPESPMAEAPDETATPAADEAERKDGDGTEVSFDPQVTLSATKATDITLTDKNSGIRVMVTGIKQDATVTDSLLNKTHTSTGDSLSYIMYSPKSPSTFSIGDTVTVTFTITQGDKTLTRTKTIEVIETRDGDGDDTGAPGGDAQKNEKATSQKNSGSKTDRSQADTSKADGSHTQGAGAGLPRTGVELTALLAAAGLLAFGTAVVAFTRRTKKQ